MATPEPIDHSPSRNLSRAESRALSNAVSYVAWTHPRAVFACPPEWSLTPNELKEMCVALRRHGSRSIYSVVSYVSLMTTGIATAASVSAGTSPADWGMLGGVFAISAGLVPAWNYRTRLLRDASPLADLDFAQIVVVTEPSRLLTMLVNANDPTPAGLRRVWDEALRCANDPGSDLDPDAAAAVQTWAASTARYERVASEWEDLLLDPLAALEHSVLLDVTKPRTAAFIAAFGKAKDVHDRHAGLPAGTVPGITTVDEFADLARAVETAWDNAKQWAAHVGYDWLPDHERTDAILADKLLRLAADETAAPAERVRAAERATAVLRRIHTIVLPEPALEVLARRTRGELASVESAGAPILAPADQLNLVETR